MAKTLFHIADIHIHDRNYDHINHAWHLLLADITAYPNYETDAILIIAGDVFDHKTYLTAGDVSLFYKMIDDLEHNRIQTIIIPGNHDYNINNSTSDKIAALINRNTLRYVEYYPKSIVFEKAGIMFYIHSPIDGGSPKPDTTHKGKRSVAIAHEPFSESRTCSGITFGTQRFSAAMFSPMFTMTLLGDIHMPQLLARNVAYAGSFVQKNKGEGISHGYMRWNVKTGTPTFTEIKQLSAHIKVWAHDNIMDKLPDVEARSISLYHTDCDDDKVKEFCQQINAKYKKAPSDVFDKTSIAPADIKIKTRHELSSVIKKKLLDCKLEKDKTDRIIALHNTVFKQTENISMADWRIRFISWSNVYCYGPDNYINFDAIGNLTSMVGPNKIGKSSIIDIIMLILFNETSRGSKKDALNVNSTGGHIKCVISVGADEYAIERVWIDRKTVIVRLYKNDINITESDIPKTYDFLARMIGSKRIFVNSTAALQHRQFIVDIGAKDIYDLVCKMMDLDRLRVIEDDNAAEIRLLRKHHKKAQDNMAACGNVTTEMLNEKQAQLQKIKDTIAKNTTNITETHMRRGQVIVDVVQGAMSSQFIASKMRELEKFKSWDGDNILAAQIAAEKKYTHNVADLEHKLNRLNQEHANIKSKITTPDSKAQLTRIKADLAKLENIDVNKILDQSAAATSSLLEKKYLILAKQRDVDNIKIQIETYKMNIIPTRQADENKLRETIDKLKTKISDANLGDIDENISSLRAALWKIAKPNCPKQHTFNVEKYDGIDLHAEIISLRKSISANNEAIAPLHNQIKMAISEACTYKSEMEKETERASFIKNMEWNSKCAQCNKNREIAPNEKTDASRRANESALNVVRLENKHKQLSDSIHESTKKLNEYETARDQIAIIQIDKFEAQLNELNQRRECVKNRICVSEQAKSDILKCEQTIAAIISNKKWLPQIDAAEHKKAECERELASLNADADDLQKHIDAIKEPMSLINMSRELREKRTSLLNDELLIDKLTVLDGEIKCVTGELDDPRKKLNAVRAEIQTLIKHKDGHGQYNLLNNQYGISLASENAADEIAELDMTLKRLNDENAELSSLLTSTSAIIGEYKSQIKITLSMQRDMDNIFQQLNDREQYNKIINHKDGIPQSMMRAMCKNIEDRCNEILRDIADFEIEVVYDKEIYIFTRSAGGRISAEQASGYQKFIIDLIMRQILCALTTSANPRILFVDEGFGSLDKNNFDIVCKRVVPALATHFEKVIIISHINGIHNYTTSNFTINNINGKSHLQYGQVAFNGINIRAYSDYDEQRKQSDERRTILEQEKKENTVALMANAQRKQDEYGDGIIDFIDEKKVRCRACDKEFRNRNGFVKAHIKSQAHLKCMATYE